MISKLQYYFITTEIERNAITSKVYELRKRKENILKKIDILEKTY